LNHGPLARAFFTLAHVVTLGLYTHREELRPELQARADLMRRMAFHRARLEAAVRRAIRVDEERDLAELRASLEFIRAHAELAGPEVVGVLKALLLRSQDAEFRWQCLRVLAELRNEKAQRVLLALEREAEANPALRELLTRQKVTRERLAAPSQGATPLRLSGFEPPLREP